MQKNSTNITENTLEQQSKLWFEEQGYNVVFGLDIAPDATNPERRDFSDMILTSRPREILRLTKTSVRFY